MARPERRDTEREPVPFPPGGDYRPGGEVGRMQADLVHRLSSREGEARRPAMVPEDRWPGERAVRFVSGAGGYLALGAAFGGVVLLVMR